VLSILGRAVFWPSKTSKRELKIGLWGRLADKAIKKPIIVIVLGLLVFGGLGLGLIGYRAAGFGQQAAPAGSDSAAGQQIVDQHYPKANDNPQLLVFHFNRSVWNNLQPIVQAQSLLNSSGVFAALSGPFNPNGLSLSPVQVQQLHGSGNPLEQSINQFISSDGKTVQFYGVLKAGPSGTVAAMRATPEVTGRLQSVAAKVGADKASDYSADTVAYDINKTTNSDLKRIIPIVLLIIAALLALLLRSLVAPWYLIISVGLSYIASLGLSMLLFVRVFNQDGINFVLPFLMFVFGMALGEDYNILVMSRIREEAHKEKTLFGAITKAIGITGTTVTSAGLILAGTFSIFGIVGGNDQAQQIGFGIAFAILLDTFFIRTLLVPSVAAKLGKWNWWPSKLSAK
ncbi:MAG TPA: MMPL family transporter, partial [Candidatus Saccharimonadales bacterium]|nr:MMPL family transporter [Candidatus Saccharimonadales bacterium]